MHPKSLGWKGLIPMVAGLAGISCKPATPLFIEQKFIAAELTQELFGGDSRCRFILRMSALDETVPVTFSWEIDSTRSVLPSLVDTQTSSTGTFLHERTTVWEWNRPDTGFALILQLSYRLEAGEHQAGGHLRTYCP